MVEGKLQKEMNAPARISLMNTRPHPGPLPWGEGDSFTVSRNFVGLSLLDAHLRKSECPPAIPSPGAAGQSEGERYTILTTAPYFELETTHVVSYK